MIYGCKILRLALKQQYFINTQIKKILWGLIAKSIHAFQNGLPFVWRLLQYALHPFKFAGKIIFKIIIIPLYTLYLAHKKTVNRVVGLRKNFFLVAFANRYIVHVTLGILALFVMGINIQTKHALAENLSSGMALARLLNPDDQLIIEYADTVLAPTVPAAANSIAPSTQNTQTPDSASNPALISQGTALVSPTIITQGNLGRTNRDEIETYIVHEGDVISSIADRFGISANTILWANNLSARSIIRPGDKLTILPFDGIRHKVTRGETIGGIAAKYNINAEQIASANGIVDAGKIALGDLLLIPGGRPLPVAAPRTTVPRTEIWSDQIPQGSTSAPSGQGYIWPSPGKRINQYYTLRHHGLDIDNNTANDPIYAIADGRVETAGWSTGGYGNYVIISHGNGIQSLYGHLKSIFAKHGQQVSQGQTIGIMGTTGRSTGIHLHFEIRVNGRTQNPFNFY